MLICNSLHASAKRTRSLPSTDLVPKPGTLTWTPPFVSSLVERSEYGLTGKKMLRCRGGHFKVPGLRLEVETMRSEMSAPVLPRLRRKEAVPPYSPLPNLWMSGHLQNKGWSPSTPMPPGCWRQLGEPRTHKRGGDEQRGNGLGEPCS